MPESDKPNQYNKDELNPPEFLNKEFFENVLRKSESDAALSITKLEMRPGTKPGDHFASVMFKAIISYTSRGKSTESRSLVVKIMPFEESAKKDMLSESPIFDREIEMYTKVLPEMHKVMQSIGDNEEFSPRLIYHSTDPLLLIFEDISKLGYGMHDGACNFDNTIKITKKLAKFHAVSYYINDNKYAHQIDFTKYLTLWNDTMINKVKVFFEGFDYLKEEVDTWPGYEVIAEKLATQDKTFIKKLLDAFEPIPEHPMNVLCHGDFHIKNMMFIKNGDVIDKTMFLDFQVTSWASPAIDLIYTLYAIGDQECRKRRGEIFLTYHECFTDYLKRLGCLKKAPTLLDLNIAVLQKGTLELLWSVCFLPFMHMDFSNVDVVEVVDSTELMGNLRRKAYKAADMVEILKDVLPELLHKGILN